MVIERDEGWTDPLWVRQNKILEDFEGRGKNDGLLGVEGAFEGGRRRGTQARSL